MHSVLTQLAERLFERIMNDHSGTLLSVHQYEDTWSFIRHADGKVHHQIPGMLDALRALPEQRGDTQKNYPLVLIAGERRSYNLTDAKRYDPISARHNIQIAHV